MKIVEVIAIARENHPNNVATPASILFLFLCWILFHFISFPLLVTKMKGQGLFGFSCFIAQSDIRRRYFMFFIFLFLFSSEGPVFIYQKEKRK